MKFSEAEADPSRLPSFTEQLVNVSSNLRISDDIPQIIDFLTNSLNVLNRIVDYQEDTYIVSRTATLTHLIPIENDMCGLQCNV